MSTKYLGANRMKMAALLILLFSVASCQIEQGKHYDLEFYPSKVDMPILNFINARIDSLGKYGVTFTIESDKYLWDSKKKYLYKNEEVLGKYAVLHFEERASLTDPF